MAKLAVDGHPRAETRHSKISEEMKFALLIIIALSRHRLGADAPGISSGRQKLRWTRIWLDSPNGKGIPPKWIYDYGTILSGVRTLWYATGEKQYFDFIKTRRRCVCKRRRNDQDVQGR